MSINLIFRFFIVVFTAYLISVWYFNNDESIIPYQVVNYWMMQPMPHWLLPDDILMYVYDFRKPLAFISLALLAVHNNFGKWGFLIFSISGPLLHTEGWGYELNWVTDLEWSIQMMQGALITMCFIGPVSEKFKRPVNRVGGGI
ncbi:hypothetical protein [Shewanella metallivivens]|uniref:DoxX family protein n=1 Tax=Shewanella metallivivens TaxID=2872342 RepID=A0ABT5TMG3_9GAMM|nr:hypothetical protein [Shewanella metallivivens]MDD8059799.1 hypothetical protein [Shewanella metallivivens]